MASRAPSPPPCFCPPPPHCLRSHNRPRTTACPRCRHLGYRTLPVEIIEQILSHLTLPEASLAALVNKSWYAAYKGVKSRKEFRPLVLVSGCGSGKMVAFDGGDITEERDETRVVWVAGLGVRDKVRSKERRAWWEYRNHPSCFCVTEEGLKVFLSQYQVLGVALFRLGAKRRDVGVVSVGKLGDEVDGVRKETKIIDNSGCPHSEKKDGGSDGGLTFERIAATHRTMLAPEGVCEINGHMYVASSYCGTIYHYYAYGGRTRKEKKCIQRNPQGRNEGTQREEEEGMKAGKESSKKEDKEVRNNSENEEEVAAAPSKSSPSGVVPNICDFMSDRQGYKICNSTEGSKIENAPPTFAKAVKAKIKKPQNKHGRRNKQVQRLSQLQPAHVSKIDLARILGVFRVEPWNMIEEPESLMPPSPPTTPRKKRRLRANSMTQDDDDREDSTEDGEEKDAPLDTFLSRGKYSKVQRRRNGGCTVAQRKIASGSSSRCHRTEDAREETALETSGRRLFGSMAWSSAENRRRHLLVSSRVQRTADPASSFGAVLRITLAPSGRLTRRVTHLLEHDKNYGCYGYFLVRPSGLAVRGDILFVACAYLSWVVKFRWGRFAGVEIPKGVVDQPWDISLDKDGRLYVCSHTAESKMDESRVIVFENGTKVAELRSNDLQSAGCVRVIQ